MVDIFKLYISAASDLKAERDLLSRSISEIPVTLAWQIHLSPIGEKRVDEKYHPKQNKSGSVLTGIQQKLLSHIVDIRLAI